MLCALANLEPSVPFRDGSRQGHLGQDCRDGRSSGSVSTRRCCAAACSPPLFWAAVPRTAASFPPPWEAPGDVFGWISKPAPPPIPPPMPTLPPSTPPCVLQERLKAHIRMRRMRLLEPAVRKLQLCWRSFPRRECSVCYGWTSRFPHCRAQRRKGPGPRHFIHALCLAKCGNVCPQCRGAVLVDDDDEALMIPINNGHNRVLLVARAFLEGRKSKTRAPV